MTVRTIAVVSAGLSTPSASRLLADRLYQATERKLESVSIPASPVVVELRDHARDITNALLTHVPSTALAAALSAVANADGLIARAAGEFADLIAARPPAASRPADDPY